MRKGKERRAPRASPPATDKRRVSLRITLGYRQRAGDPDSDLKSLLEALTAARLHLFALAYNLGNCLRQSALPRSIRIWSLTTLREKLVKNGAKVVTHAKYVVFQLAEVAVPRQLFAAILERIGRLRLAGASG
jgi:hypothetical protein